MMQDYEGLFDISHMNYQIGLNFHNNKLYKEMKEAYLIAIELQNSSAMNGLGNYYDDNGVIEEMLKYYLMASEYDNVASLYNLGRYYYEVHQYEEMKNYFERVIKLGDIDSMYDLAIYYQKINDIDNFKKYYLLAINTENNITTNFVNDGILEFNVLLVSNMLETINNPSQNVINKLNIIKKSNEYNIYKNKIQLFTRLNNIDNCIICFEDKLLIDLHCGHCFCVDCYPHFIQTNCPLCRSSSRTLVNI